MWLLVRMGIGVGLLAYLATSRAIDFRALTKLISTWPLSIAGIAFIFLDIVLMALRLSWLFRPQGMRLTFANSLELTLVSSFFATFLPGAAGGDLAKLYYAAKDNKGHRAEIITVVIFDRAIGLFSLLLLPLLFAPLFPQLIETVEIFRALLSLAVLSTVCLLFAFLLCLFRPALVNSIVRWGFKFLPQKRLSERIVDTIAAYKRCPGTLIAALGVSLAANLTLIGATSMAILALHPASMDMRLCFVIPLGDLANNLPLTPGGLGVGEAAYNALFKLAGLDGGAEALLCWRIWRAVVGMLGLILYLRGPGRSVFNARHGSEGKLR